MSSLGITLRDYWSGFRRLYIGFSAIPFLTDAAGAYFKDSGGWLACLYPPLGAIQVLGEIFTFLFLLSTPFLVYLGCRSKNRIKPRVPIFLGIGATCLFVALVALYTFFVRRVAVPSVGTQIYVSVGYQRTDLAKRVYPGWNDWEMLHDRGPSEEQIQALWTGGSVFSVRAGLWLGYTLCCEFFVAVWCLMAFQQAMDSKAILRSALTPRPVTRGP